MNRVKNLVRGKKQGTTNLTQLPNSGLEAVHKSPTRAKGSLVNPHPDQQELPPQNFQLPPGTYGPYTNLPPFNESAVIRQLSSKFIKRARVTPFQPSHAHIPTPKDSYNDDVAIPHCSSAARTYADKQRRGLQEAHIRSLSIDVHLGQAPSSPFFLSLCTPPHICRKRPHLPS